MDYSWKVIKSEDYTRNRQKLLHLQGKEALIGYLINSGNDLIRISKMVFDTSNPEPIFQTITGISKKYRGKGLVKML